MARGAGFPVCGASVLGGAHLEELDPLLAALGAGVGHPQDPEFRSEQVGSIFLHRGHIEAEDLGGDSFGADGQLI